MQDPTLYLIPVALGDSPLDRMLPPYNRSVILSLRHFIVENERSARRFLKQVEPGIGIDLLDFSVLNRHTAAEGLGELLLPMERGLSVGLLSEAGCPAVADPGADVVAMAQRRGFRVEPLVGPSSILLALMASGLNGQQFAFHGYLPVEGQRRRSALKRLEREMGAEGRTQLFIETPYRNRQLLLDILAVCRPETRLCVAADITLPTEEIRTRRVAEWRREVPELGKRLCIFAMGA